MMLVCERMRMSGGERDRNGAALGLGYFGKASEVCSSKVPSKLTQVA